MFQRFSILAICVTLGACTMDADEPPAEAEDLAALTSAGWTPVAATDAAPLGSVITSATALACPAQFVCVYQNGNRGVRAFAFRAGFGTPDFRTFSCPECTNGTHGNDGTFNDQMSSWENRSGVQYCWYYDINFSTKNIFHHMGNGDIHNAVGDENDRASSLQPCP